MEKNFKYFALLVELQIKFSSIDSYNYLVMSRTKSLQKYEIFLANVWSISYRSPLRSKEKSANGFNMHFAMCRRQAFLFSCWFVAFSYESKNVLWIACLTASFLMYLSDTNRQADNRFIT